MPMDKKVTVIVFPFRTVNVLELVRVHKHLYTGRERGRDS